MKSLMGVVIAGMTLAPSLSSAQDFPTDTVTMIIPFSAGGSNDGIGRYLANGLGELWGETVVVENRPGAGAAVGASYVARSRPDGHTLLFVSGTLTVTAATREDLPFDPLEDLQPVAMGARGQMVFVSGSRVPIDSMQDLVREANEQTIFYGTTGVGSITHLTSELFNQVAGISMEPVHYGGGTDALVDIAGGRLDVYAGSVTQVLSSVTNDMATPLAVASDAPSSALPDTPTLAEQGFEGAEVDLWWGVSAAAGTPAEVVEKINADIRTVLETEAAAAFLESQGAMPHPMSVEEFGAHYRDEISKWSDLVETLGISVQ